MSKKDYQAIARVFYARRSHEEHAYTAWTALRDDLAALFAADNPRFDRRRFLNACETGDCKGMRKAS